MVVCNIFKLFFYVKIFLKHFRLLTDIICVYLYKVVKDIKQDSIVN